MVKNDAAVKVCGSYLVLAGSHSDEDPSVKVAALTEINNDCSRNLLWHEPKCEVPKLSLETHDGSTTVRGHQVQCGCCHANPLDMWGGQASGFRSYVFVVKDIEEHNAGL